MRQLQRAAEERGKASIPGTSLGKTRAQGFSPTWLVRSGVRVRWDKIKDCERTQQTASKRVAFWRSYPPEGRGQRGVSSPNRSRTERSSEARTIERAAMTCASIAKELESAAGRIADIPQADLENILGRAPLMLRKCLRHVAPFEGRGRSEFTCR